MTRWSNSGGTAVNLDSLRLDPGSHRSPRDGVCLLELTSLLAEEEFSDRPRCVCKVIAAFLRGWNDRLSHAERQRLRPYANRVIGSRAPRAVSRRRRDICLIWAGADLSGNALSRAVRRTVIRLRIMGLCGIGPALRLSEGAGDLAARVVFAHYDFETGLRLVDALLEVGTERESRDGDVLARAVVERALRDPVPLPHEPGLGNGNGNGHRSKGPTEVAKVE
ncbi:MAG: hypothetical protein ACJ75I_01085 [Solirubrobacterales bacterium]